MQELKEYLIRLAKKQTRDNEDSTIMEDCGGNFDDAYSIGLNDGEIYLAREILFLYFNHVV